MGKSLKKVVKKWGKVGKGDEKWEKVRKSVKYEVYRCILIKL